MPIPLAVIVRL